MSVRYSDRNVSLAQKEISREGAIEAARVQTLPGSALAKGCNCTLTLWSRLTRFLDYPQLELSTNLTWLKTRYGP
jgi:hypothetical protein